MLQYWLFGQLGSSIVSNIGSCATPRPSSYAGLLADVRRQIEGCQQKQSGLPVMGGPAWMLVEQELLELRHQETILLQHAAGGFMAGFPCSCCVCCFSRDCPHKGVCNCAERC